MEKKCDDSAVSLRTLLFFCENVIESLEIEIVPNERWFSTIPIENSFLVFPL